MARDELVERVTLLCTATDFPEDAGRLRVECVITVLVAVGDIGAIESSEGSLVFRADGRRISIGNGSDALIGSVGAGPVGWQERSPRTLSRRTAHEFNSTPLVDFLGYPERSECFADLPLGTSPDFRAITIALHDVVAGQASAALPGEWKRVVPLRVSDLWLMKDSLGSWALGLPRQEGIVALFLLDRPDQAGWLYLGARGVSALSEWPEQLVMPDQVLRSLGILALPRDDTLRRWEISDEAAEFLNGWLGLEETQAESGADPYQDEVVLAPVAARLIVEAGPGSGKTWVACRRVSQLINDGVAPARIILLSFTRAAVTEIRERIGSFLDDPDLASDVTITTLDAFVWRLFMAAESRSDRIGSHDETVRAVLGYVKNGERDIVSFLGRVEHLIVDEAQDLTGDRKDLVSSMIRNLREQCGVTVFLDPAQAIYGFTNEDENGLGDELGRPDSGFAVVSLKTDYRTKTEALKSMIAAARPVLGGETAEPSEVYEIVRELIEAAASGKVSAASNQEVSPGDGKTFVLFRSRAEVLSATNDMLRAGRRFRVRLAGGAGIVEPWIGASLAGIEAPIADVRLVADAFEQLKPLPLLSFEEAWATLRRHAPSDGAGVDLDRIAELCSSQNPPSELVRTDLGHRSGPLLSTIHAAKGREADTVHLMLPRWPERSDTNWMEEARVLFVGASRARRKLKIGSAKSSLYPLKGSRERRWRPFTRYGRPDALVQVGIPGDIDFEFQNSSENWGSESGVLEGRERLWRYGSQPVPLRAVRNGDRYRLELDDTSEKGGALGWLSKQFSKDLWTIGEQVCGARTPPPNIFGGFWLIAVATMASSSIEGGRLRIGLSPVITGTPLIHFSSRT